MKTTLTIADARKLEQQGRVHMPIQFDTALKALKECTTLDEAKQFDNAAEALAAWARIYRKDEAGRQARQLRLFAHRRMGELAQELAPGKNKPGGGRHPGPVAKLKELGLSHHQADAANHLAKLKKRDFNKLVKQDIPPAPTSAAKRFRKPGSTTQWTLLRAAQRNPFVCTTFIANTDATELARKLNKGEVKLARQIALDMIDWLDEFEQALPKS